MISALLETISNLILSIIEKSGYMGVFFLMALESANIPIPSEVIMPFAGFLAASGVFYFWLVVVAGAFGNLTGALFSYWLGYLTRRGILRWNNHKASNEVERIRKWLDRFGDGLIFFSRLLPIIRTFISFPLGVLKAKSLWRFSALTFLGSLIWSALLTYLGFVFGKNWQILQVYFRKFDYLILLLLMIVIGWRLWTRFKNKKHKISQN